METPIRLADRMKRGAAEGSTRDATEKVADKAPPAVKEAESRTLPPRTRQHRRKLAEKTAQQKRGKAGQFREKWSEAIWTEIEAEYRAGDLPIAELSRIFGPSPATIVQHMADRRVTRDLQGKVAARLRDKILRDGQRPATREGPGGRDLTEDEQLAEAAAARAFKTVKLHQRAAAKLREFTQKCLTVAPTKKALADPKTMKAFSETARNTALALDKLVAIERKAFGIDEREEAAKRLKIELD